VWSDGDESVEPAPGRTALHRVLTYLRGVAHLNATAQQVVQLATKRHDRVLRSALQRISDKVQSRFRGSPVALSSRYTGTGLAPHLLIQLQSTVTCRHAGAAWLCEVNGSIDLSQISCRRFRLDPDRCSAQEERGPYVQASSRYCAVLREIFSMSCARSTHHRRAAQWAALRPQPSVASWRWRAPPSAPRKAAWLECPTLLPSELHGGRWIAAPNSRKQAGKDCPLVCCAISTARGDCQAHTLAFVNAERKHGENCLQRTSEASQRRD